MEWRIREAEARRQSIGRLIKAARRTGGYLCQCRGRGTHTSDFATWDSISCTNQAVEAIAPLGWINAAIGQDRNCLARIVPAGIEACDIVRLRVGRSKVVETSAEFETK